MKRLVSACPRLDVVKRSVCIEGAQMAFARVKVQWAKMNAVKLATEGPPTSKEHCTPERGFGVFGILWSAIMSGAGLSSSRSFLPSSSSLGVSTMYTLYVEVVVHHPGLESEIGTWIKAYRHILNAGLSAEHDLCVRVFVGRNAGLGRDIFADLARCAMLQMFNFTEAVAMTKRAAEKLFKVLDMYEAIRDGAPVVDGFISTNKAEGGENSSGAEALADLKSELASVRSRLGESAAAIFCDLESSIRADAGKQPVPGGAVHPLTRYLMNYLKYACEYKNTLEQVFREFHRPDADDAPGHEGESNPFAAQLMEVMELLHGSLEAKSKLYKDLALSSIFLMNNGRYMLQKIRGSPEINAVVGEAWARKRSTDLRQYHKNYQRETWGRVLNVLRDDGGITSELRVSIAAVVVPAYRSFLGRFAQHFTAGRQTEKYIKLSADDLEGIIEELFEGSAGSMSRRRN
ncbi:unnamed protein product [Triticum turgidum subsp. durum]|uniref:Exocyst subunit Exo70 family protein n=1 Tax=Triticum turgidum subsp. durum TaxID=4567 RepID=A0A9R0SEE5_TRITD|nr:unnamed protein product [Triticum turgidum subsp. durum]